MAVESRARPVAASRRRWGGLLLREKVDGYVMILPWLLGFVLFTAGPMLVSAGLAFTNYDTLVADAPDPDAPEPGMVKGPYVAETYPVSIDGQYLVVDVAT